MSLICFDTDTQYILFNNWISEVHEKAKIISGQQDPLYLVYVDEDEDYKTYVYFVNGGVNVREIDFKAEVIKDMLTIVVYNYHNRHQYIVIQQ